MNIQTLIFDFDGTLADTHQFIIEISNSIAPEFNYKQIEPQDIPRLKNKTSKEVIRELNVPILKIPLILAKAKKIFNENIADIKPFDHIEKMLIKLKEADIQIGILSSNSKENVDAFLESHNIHFFDFVYTTPKVWSKNTSLKHILKSNNLDKNHVMYVGDEARDIEAAKKVDLKTVAVTWGYNDRDVLIKHKPHHLIDTPLELLQLFNIKF